MRPMFVLMSALLLLTACEATAGLGKDISKGGKNLQDAAEKLKP